MGEKNSKPIAIVRPTSTAPDVKQLSGQSKRPRIVQNYLLVWLDTNVTASSDDSQHTLQQLRSVVNDVNLFMEPDECVAFLKNIQLEKVFLIASGSLGQDLLPRIHLLTQIDAIYIFCGDKSRHEGWVKKWPKVKGVYTQINPICQALELAVKQCNQDCTAVSYAPPIAEGASDINLNQLEPSFMYTQLFKKTLLDIEHDREKAVRDLVAYCQEKYVENTIQLNLISEFSRDYRSNEAIRWYTREGFTYQMLNRALRLLEADIIVNMGFFIHDLHQQIQQLHEEQVERYGGKPFPVYRGQGFSNADFEKLNKSRGGLISFNCFLSTSRSKESSMVFVNNNTIAQDRVGVLFLMSIDPNITSTPFADAQGVSFYPEEGEIIFSMHTVFRIQTIEPLSDGRGHFQVNLTLTNDDDAQLRILTDQFDADVQTSDGWKGMARLLIEVGQPDKAEELYRTLLAQTSNPIDQGQYYHQLGCIKDAQGDYTEALRSYERALEIRSESLPASHPDLATSYSCIGSVYDNMGEYLKALSSHERALKLTQESLPEDHRHLATSYNNIGSVYDNMGEYSKALSSHTQALEIRQRSLPVNHPHLATSYSCIGSVYENMGEYSKALSFHKRALEIRRKSLPENHPHLATSYNNIGSVYMNMDEYSKALSSYERALSMQQKSLPANHPDTATSYSCIGSVNYNMGDYSKALSSFKRALDIRIKSLPVNHPDLATSYSCIGSVYDNMGEYSKALSSFERALEMQRKSLPATHPHLAISYNNIGSVYMNMRECSKALSSYEQALEIQTKSLPANHPQLAISCGNIASAYENKGDYSKALSSYEQALEMLQKSPSANHPHLQSVRESVKALKIKLNKSE